jgi:hypothetical protein
VIAVGSKVIMKRDLYEGPDDCHPGGYLAKKGDRLIVREIRDAGQWPFKVSHEDRTDGLTFGVSQDEILEEL